MSVPLDRLYNFLRDICDHDVIIYRFFPHGSKNMNDCVPLVDYTWYEKMSAPFVLCYDQECIDLKLLPHNVTHWKHKEKFYKSEIPYPWFKMRSLVPYQFYNKVILIHSEKNSQAVETLTNDGYIPVHWFSHGLIARDWFRFAEHDPMLRNSNPKHKFLIYNRAWSGTREYRIHFADQLVKNQLVDHCLTSFGFYDNQVYYGDHVFKNSTWSVTEHLEDYFDANIHDSNASADYQAEDYNNCAIEVVLETIFDDSKLHLTEKSLRPIAVGKPFMLVASRGALAYLRDYGFETFSPWIDESYDSVEDPVLRMQLILKELRRLAQLNPCEFNNVVDQCNKIAQRNRNRFFSADFFNAVIGEYQHGVNAAVEQCIADVSRENWDQWAKDQDSVPDVQDIMQNLRLL